MRELIKREIMDIELEMLKVFSGLCDENNLYYTLSGGTLLGAIRHNGFIPWDDDIDVTMPRPDFERLQRMIQAGSLELPGHLRFISWFTDPRADIPFIKLIDTRTIVEEKYMANDTALWIDIFAIDGCPDNEKKLKDQFRESKLIRNILFKKQTRAGTGKSRVKSTLKDIIRNSLKTIDGKWLCTRLDTISSKYSFESSMTAACIMWGYGPQERVNKEKWITPIEVEFEGCKFKAPSNYDEYLSNLYGDYMQLPEESKRISHDMVVRLRTE